MIPLPHCAHVGPVSAAITALLLGVTVLAGPPAAAQTPEPYRDPPFTCEVIDYGKEAPTLPAPDDDPLCVRYDKSDITVSTLGAIDFLAAEPGRVALVAGKCSYWQQDHWVIRVSPETPPLLSWHGSYWYDARTGSAGGILRDLRVADQPASGEAFIEAMRPLVGDEQADQFEQFADDGGGGGLSMQLPEGFAVDQCAAGQPGGAPEPSPEDEPAPATTGPPVPAAGPSSATSPNLPATGGGVPDLAFWLLGALVLGAAARHHPG